MKILPPLFILCVLIACKKNEPGIQLSQIQGKWNIVNAYRNGNVTDSVQDGYFSFGMNNTFETNIPGLPNGQNFEFTRGKFQINGDTSHYQFVNVSDSSASIKVIIRTIPFLFVLRKN